MSREALLIIDVQNDFCPGGSLPVPDGDKVVSILNEVKKHTDITGRLTILTRDWHPVETTHFKKYGGIWPQHCVQDTEGAKFHPELDTKDILILSKGMGAAEDAYSAFEARDEDGVTLDDILREHGIKKLIVGGLATDYCVLKSVLHSRIRNIEIELMEDAIAAVNISPDDGKIALDEMKAAGAIITNSKGVITRLLKFG